LPLIPFPSGLLGFRAVVTAAIAASKTIVVVPNATGAGSRAGFALTAAPIFAPSAVIARIAEQALARPAGYALSAAAVIIAAHALAALIAVMVGKGAALSAAMKKHSSLLRTQTRIQVLISMTPAILFSA